MAKNFGPPRILSVQHAVQRRGGGGNLQGGPDWRESVLPLKSRQERIEGDKCQINCFEGPQQMSTLCSRSIRSFSIEKRSKIFASMLSYHARCCRLPFRRVPGCSGFLAASRIAGYARSERQHRRICAELTRVTSTGRRCCVSSTTRRCCCVNVWPTRTRPCSICGPDIHFVWERNSWVEWPVSLGRGGGWDLERATTSFVPAVSGPTFIRTT